MYQQCFKSAKPRRWVGRCRQAGTCHATHVKLRNVGIVLVSPKNPENIGSVLRVSGNFGIGKVVLVNPRCSFRDGKRGSSLEDRVASSDDADIISKVACKSPLLDSLDAVDTLSDALAQAKVSICFTRRSGVGRRTEDLHSFLSSNGSLAASLTTTSERDSTPSVMLVFGREEHGLFQEEIQACSHAIEIPSNADFPSLNLSHAVAVVVSRLYEWVLYDDKNATDDCIDSDLADHSELNALLSRVTKIVSQLGLETTESRGGGDQGNHGRRLQPLGHLRNMVMRSRATTQEVRSLFGLVKSASIAIDNCVPEKTSD